MKPVRVYSSNRPGSPPFAAILPCRAQQEEAKSWSYLQLSDYDPLWPADGLISISTRCISTQTHSSNLARKIISARLVCPKQVPSHAS